MKKTTIILLCLVLQACGKTYSLAKSDSTTTMVVNDIYLPSYKTILFLNTMNTLVTMQSSLPGCPFDGGFMLKNHLGDIKLTQKKSTQLVNIDKIRSTYASYTVTEHLPGGFSECKSSLRIDPKPFKKYRLSINGKECMAALYEANLNGGEFVRSSDAVFGSFRDERLCST